MKIFLFATIILILFGGCGPSRIHDNYRLKGLTKGQRVKNNLLYAKIGKKLKEIFAKIAKPEW